MSTRKRGASNRADGDGREPQDLRGLADLYRLARDEYAADGSVFADETSKAERAKRALATLPDAERALFVAYAELGSLRKLARAMRCSTMRMQEEIKRIRNAIIAAYNRLEG